MAEPCPEEPLQGCDAGELWELGFSGGATHQTCSDLLVGGKGAVGLECPESPAQGEVRCCPGRRGAPD